MQLLFPFTFELTSQTCAKTPKYVIHIILFSPTHAHILLMDYSASFVLPINNRVNEASLRSPYHMDKLSG